ncbi:hypothetical protein KF707_16440 [Candidatus Obscuribacterales bacterium]|jgi:hypothetical protein|nr:hypothetical protein [Candidatus Obscuribacterales bacterium]
MSDAPQRKAATPAPESREEFDASYNELPAPNPLFTEYSQSQGAPTRANDSVTLPRNSGDTVVVDGRVVSGQGDGQIVINHANVVNIYRGDRSPQETRYEQISGNVFDGRYSDYQGPPSSTFRGHRPLYGQDAADAFYAHRGPEHMRGGGRTRAWSYSDYSAPPVYRDSVIAGGPQGVVFRDTTSGYGPDGVVIQDRGVSGRDIMATTVALANSDLARILINRHGGNDRGYHNYRRPAPVVDYRYDSGYPGTPPFVDPGYDSSTVYGGRNGVVFRDSGYDYQRGNSDFRDLAAFGVALANSPLVGLLDHGGNRYRGNYRGGDDCYSGGRNNYYNQNLARERFANNYRNNQLRISLRLSA